MLFQIRGQNTTALGPNLDTLLKTYRNRAAPLHSYIIRSHLSPVVAQMNTKHGGSEVKASACNAGALGSIPGSGRPPGEGNGNPLQYSYLENPMEGGEPGGLQFTGWQRVGHD